MQQGHTLSGFRGLCVCIRFFFASRVCNISLISHGTCRDMLSFSATVLLHLKGVACGLIAL